MRSLGFVRPSRPTFHQPEPEANARDFGRTEQKRQESGHVDQVHGESVVLALFKDIDVQHEVASSFLLGPQVDQA